MIQIIGAMVYSSHALIFLIKMAANILTERMESEMKEIRGSDILTHPVAEGEESDGESSSSW